MVDRSVLEEDIRQHKLVTTDEARKAAARRRILAKMKGDPALKEQIDEDWRAFRGLSDR